MALADDWDHWANSFPARIARAWRDFLEDIDALSPSLDYDDISGNDAATDVSGGELEELTDGSTTTLHEHAYDYSDISGNDAATDITASELEELTDGSTTTLHEHAYDYSDISGNDAATDVTASELEELTDGSETTLHSHAGTVAAVVPHYSAGSGDWNVIAHQTFSIYINGTAKISAFDLVRSVQGGSSTPSYTFFIRKNGGSYGAGHSNPIDEYVTYTSSDAGVVLAHVKVSDGTTTSTETEISIVITN